MAREDAFLDADVDVKSFVSSPDIVTKYKTAGDIAQRALAKVAEACVEGAKILDLCLLGDSTIEAAVASVYNAKGAKKVSSKGIAFPTTVCPNNTLAYLSPLASDPEAAIALKNGDSVKIELGVHIDGYIAQAGITVVVGASKTAPVTGSNADAIAACYTASEMMIRLLKPGQSTLQIAQLIEKAMSEYGCKSIENTLTVQIGQHEMEVEKYIMTNPSETQKREDFTIEEGDAFTVTLQASTGEGKARQPETAKTTIYRRNNDRTYDLKLKTSRQVLAEASNKFGLMAFTLRSLAEPVKARMGLQECVNHQLIEAFPVIEVRDDNASLARIVFTVLVMPTGAVRVTEIEKCGFDKEVVQSDKQVKDEEVVKVLKSAVKTKPKKAKKETTA